MSRTRWGREEHNCIKRLVHTLRSRKAHLRVMNTNSRVHLQFHLDPVVAWHLTVTLQTPVCELLRSVLRLQTGSDFCLHCCPRTDEQLPSEKPEMPEANPLYKGSRKMSGRAAAQAAALTAGPPIVVTWGAACAQLASSELAMPRALQLLLSLKCLSDVLTAHRVFPCTQGLLELQNLQLSHCILETHLVPSIPWQFSHQAPPNVLLMMHLRASAN